MNKTAIKNFAIWARLNIIESAKQRAYEYEITKDGQNNPSAEIINGRPLSKAEQNQRRQLIEQIKIKGFDQVMEEAAYTWFNRFIALRYIEVNGYLPTRIRVFTNEEGEFKPEILKEAMTVELDGLDREKVLDLLDKQDNEALYKMLLITQCNALSDPLPYMFEKIANWTELLFPANLLRADSVIDRMISAISEEDWKDQVQIIGWLYQYYNSEKKDDVFAALKKNVKITKENIPAATQLFTPDWIVRYMVENSLGRLWVEGHPNDELKANWKYYLEEAEQEPEVQAKLAEIRKEYAALNPEDIKVIDPCCGSGHILAYMFDVLMQIYEANGYVTRDAVRSIVENNIYGLDIDDRAAQLAYFSVMMKGRQYDSRFFKRGVQPHVYAIEESNGLDPYTLDYFCGGDAKLEKAMNTIVDELHDAKEHGSILTVTPQDWSYLYDRFDAIFDDISIYRESALAMLPMVQVAEALAQKYSAVITNPPYMGGSGMSAKLSDFVKKNYPDSKSDLFAVFIEHCGTMTAKYGYQAMITQHAWMFLSSFEKLRAKLQVYDTVNMAHLGARAFEEIGGEVVQTTSFVVQKNHIKGYKGTYCRLIEPTTQKGKEDMFLAGENRYTARQDNFEKIPGSPVAYWVSDRFIDNFNNECIEHTAACRSGMSTTDNERFLRIWSEVSNKSIGFNYKAVEDTDDGVYKWVPYNKGGEKRKWYGNKSLIVNWQNNGAEIKHWVVNNPRDPKTTSWSRRLFNIEYSFKESLTWSALSSGGFSIRYCEPGSMFDSKGASCFPINNKYYICGLLNSTVAQYYLDLLCPTLDYGVGQVGKIPLIRLSDTSTIDAIVSDCISLSKVDWDSFETSWDFSRHPMLPVFADEPDYAYKVEEFYHSWEQQCEERFNQLKSNEEELNRIFIDIYGLQDELTPEVEDKDVTVRKADLPRDIKSLISYAVGCMFGRYSLDTDGLAYAGGDWDASKYHTYPADRDNIIPICDDEYFEDDIVNRFVKFIEVVYSKDTLEENLKFIADALGGKGQPREVIRNYFLNDFYADHLKIYQKRPIYWLFDSSKKNGFKCLIYMHRYQPDTIARIRTDYVHEMQSRYRTAIADLEERTEHASASERVKLSKQLAHIKDQDLELRKYEEKIHHLADQMIEIDLDDGVKVNYAKFGDVLAKIK